MVPFSAGSVTDLLARIIGEKLGERWGQQLIVENRPGIPGTASVAKSAPDGYTLMLTSNGHTVAAVLNKNLPFDPVREFSGVTQVASVPLVLIVPPDLPATTLRELVALAKDRPGALNFASSGLASTAYISGELFKQTAKIDIVHVPYKGAPESLTGIMRADSHMFFAGINIALDLIQSGKVRPLAVAAPKRIATLPAVPTFAEAGMPEFEYDAWFGVMAPANTPIAIRTKVSQDVATVLRTRRGTEALGKPGGGDGRQCAAGIRCADQIGYRALRQDAQGSGRRRQLGARFRRATLPVRSMEVPACRPWCSRRRGRRCACASGRCQCLQRGKYCSRSRPAAFAVPICMWWTASLPHPKLPLIPGHEIVGRVAALGADVAGLAVGERIGVPWLGYTCGVCPYCRAGRENLCDRPLFTGYTRDGGYATHALADARFCFPLPERRDDAEIAPFLCAGLIGWRSYRMAGAHGEGKRTFAEGASLDALGLYGFGAAAHILAQVAAWQGRRVYAFTRSGDTAAQAFAKSLGRGLGRRLR